MSVGYRHIQNDYNTLAAYPKTDYQCAPAAEQEQLAAQDIRAAGPLVWHPGWRNEGQSLPEGQPPTGRC